MSARLDDWLKEWAESVIQDTYKSNYSGINAVERILRSPGIATGKAQHKVLWWPKSRRVAKVSKAAHQLNPIEIIVLLVHYGNVVNDDESRFTKHDLVKNSSMTLREFNRYRKKAKTKLSTILRTYRKRFDRTS